MFVQAGHTPNRFSLLLLDEGEYYFEDFGVFYYPTAENLENSLKKKQKGRVKLCSKSILFEPDDSRFPISKFPFDNIVGCGKCGGELAKLIQNNEIFLIRSEVRVDMKESNQNYPYKFHKEKGQYSFSLQFDTLLNFLPKVQNLLRISQLPIGEHEKQLSDLIDQHEAGILFNHTWLMNISERSQIELTGVRVTPLVNNPGRIVVTESRLYFQPLNNVGARPVDRFELSHIVRIYKRRHSLRHVGLEIFFRHNNDSLYLSFKSQAIRNRVYDTIMQQQCVPRLPPNDFETMTEKWRNRSISNYDYLMYLNNQAHRSFNDLTQYPVFPWIIADYDSPVLDLNDPKTYRDLSKPIGALTEDRLANLKNRFELMCGMPDQKPFLYGTHYSTPGYVLYYLVRKAPEYMLRLQNGRFDAPNRMFHSIKETWEGVLVNPSDVKEIIPEFYTEPGDFLINGEGLKLGSKQNGEVLDDVILPPWASSPRDFIRKHREALESEYVSSHLHQWINLIFGFAQTGEEAVKANNVFYPLTYEGAVDIETIRDPFERKSIEAQINEFGQTPHQLFSSPHPTRLPLVHSNNQTSNDNNNFRILSSSNNNNNNNNNNNLIKSSNDELRKKMDDSFDFIFNNNQSLSSPVILSNTQFDSLDDRSKKRDPWPLSSLLSLTPSYTAKLHKEGITGVKIGEDGKTIYTVSSDGSLKFFDIENRKLSRSIPICELALSSIQVMDDCDRLFLGSWDNHLYIYSREYGRIKEKIYAHDDAISCLKISRDLMISGSWDCTVKIWQLSSSANTKYLPVFDCTENDSHISAVDLSMDGNVAMAGTNEGTLLAFDRRDHHSLLGLSFSSFPAHSNKISGIEVSNDHKTVMTCSLDGTVKLFDLSSKLQISSLSFPSPILSMESDGEKAIAGMENGHFAIFDIKKKEILHTFQRQQSAITSIATSADGNLLISASSDATVVVWK